LEKGRRVNGRIAFWLTAIPGLLGLFGLGHFYLRKPNPALGFLVYSGILYALLAGILIFPSASVTLATIAPAMWAIGWLYAMYDTRRIAKKMTAQEAVEQQTAVTIVR
jgi:hypothetical protein